MRIRVLIRNYRGLAVQVLFIGLTIIAFSSNAKASEKMCSEFFEEVIYFYSSAQPGVLDNMYKSYVTKTRGISLNTKKPTTIPYLSLQDLVGDVVFSFSKRGEGFQNQSEFFELNNFNLYGRKNKQNPKVVLVDEKNINEIFFKYNKSVSMFVVLREDSSKSKINEDYLSSYPIVEVTRFKSVDTNLNSDVFVALSSPRTIDKLIKSKQDRSQFFGRTYGMGIATYWGKKSKLQSSDVKKVKHISFKEIETEVEAFDPYLHAPGFRSVEESKRFDLGSAQPNIVISKSLINFVKKHPSSLQEVKGTVAHWYKKVYQVKIDSKNLEFAEGVSDGLLKLLSELSSGSKIAIPHPGYYVYEAIAKKLNLKIIPLDLSKDLRPQLESLDNDVEGLVVNFPNNPLGLNLNEYSGKLLANWARNTGKWVMNDLSNPLAAYEGARVWSLLEFGTEGLIEVFGTSKELGLAEERVSVLVGDINKVSLGKESGGTRIDSFRISLLKRRLDQLLENPLVLTNELEARYKLITDAFKKAGWPKSAIRKPSVGLNILLEAPPGLTPMEFATQLWNQAQILVSPGYYISGSYMSDTRLVRVTLSESSQKLKGLSNKLKKSNVFWDTFKN